MQKLLWPKTDRAKTWGTPRKSLEKKHRSQVGASHSTTPANPWLWAPPGSAFPVDQASSKGEGALLTAAMTASGTAILCITNWIDKTLF